MSAPTIKNELFHVSLYGAESGVVIPTSVQRSQTLLASTITPLLAAATYTSASSLADTYESVCGTCFSDVGGTLYVEFSSNGINWDGAEMTAYAAGDQVGFLVECLAPYVRVRFVNGAIAQATFRLYLFGKR